MTKKVSKAAAGGVKKPAKKPVKKAASKTAGKRPTKASTQTTADSASGKPALLAGGNPQIARGYGDEPVQAYIAAMEGWKSGMGRRLDALIVQSVPGVAKAVKYNSPIYGAFREGDRQDWFLGIHVFATYVKVAFFRGAQLRPMPPGESKQKDVRYLDIHENDPLDESQFADWVKQASKLPGEKM